MRIDFHCHTKAVKSGEKKTRNINATDFKEAIKDARVKMVAVTNHNSFDRSQFDEFYNEVNNDFILLPGIELDTIGIKKEKGHIVIVYDDKDLDNFDNKVSKLLEGTSPDTFTIDIEKLIEFINDINCIVLAHYYKPDALDIESINHIKEKMTDNFRLFYEPSNYRTLGIMINHNFRALKGTDIVDWSNYGDQEFANIKLDIDSYKQLIKFLKKDETVIESLINKQTQLNKLIAELFESIKTSYSYNFDEKTSIKLTNSAISKIKSIVEKKTETKTIPNETGFINFAKNHFSLEIKINKILNGFKFEYESSPEYIGKLEEEKLLYKKTIITMLNESSKSDDGFKGINNLKEIKAILKAIKNDIYNDNLANDISNYKEKYEQDLSLDDFIGIIKKFIVDGKDYKPSTGEATMIVLNDALDEKYDVYILDEPEKSLGNNYVSDVLVSRLNDLARMKKVVVVATHNANVAVRTMPYRSILKVYDNGKYKTFIGNPYVNKLINVKDEKEYKDWKEESIRILEGGKEAFDERSDIYA